MPMSALPRIDELKKRYEENPRRFYATLANEYRKAGNVEQAISLCEQHVSEQPVTLNAWVVYGQALTDAGRLDEAAATFRSALSLDPENLIALRHLGDIARASGNAGEARDWYARVLDVDPRNHEITSMLAQLPAASKRVPTPAGIRAATPPAATAHAASSAPRAATPVVGVGRSSTPRTTTPAETPSRPVDSRSRTPAPVDRDSKTPLMSAAIAAAVAVPRAPTPTPSRAIGGGLLDFEIALGAIPPDSADHAVRSEGFWPKTPSVAQPVVAAAPAAPAPPVSADPVTSRALLESDVESFGEAVEEGVAAAAPPSVTAAAEPAAETPARIATRSVAGGCDLTKGDVSSRPDRSRS